MSNRSITAIAAALGTLVVQGCATESAAFRHMSAEAHEQAAHGAGPAESTGVTPEDHLMVAARLRAEEQSACVEVPDAERDAGPLARRERIEGVETLRDRPHPKEMLQPAGVALYLRATPGLTEQWLGRLLRCHLAHHAVVGDRLPDNASPLFVDDARIALSSTSDGFRISITARDAVSAREIIAKAHALVE